MASPRFTPTQIYYLHTMHTKGTVSYMTVATWDQRPLRGLYLRGLFDFHRGLDASLTAAGEEALRETRHARLRQHPENPLFGGRTAPMRVVPRKRRAA